MGNTCRRSYEATSELKKDFLVENVVRPLEQETKFSSAEIEQLFHRFCKMAVKADVHYSPPTYSPRLSFQDLMDQADSRNPLCERIILAFMGPPKGTDLMHQIERGRMDFPEFVRAMSIFTPNSSSQEKKAFIFRIYDKANSEVINLGDIKALLAEIHGDEMTDIQREISARNFLAEFQAEDAGEVTKDAFIQGCDGTLVDDMVVRFT